MKAGPPCLPVTACPDTDPGVTAAPASAEEGSLGKTVLRKSFRALVSISVKATLRIRDGTSLWSRG